MPNTGENGYLVQLISPEGDKVYPVISAEMIKDANGNTYDLAGLKNEFAELKTSVSEGKALIAAAVTDKGVQTAADATFQQIATNIISIFQLDTSDATATADKIESGYTAYAKGVKLNGSMVAGIKIPEMSRINVPNYSDYVLCELTSAPKVVLVRGESDNKYGACGFWDGSKFTTVMTNAATLSVRGSSLILNHATGSSGNVLVYIFE